MTALSAHPRARGLRRGPVPPLSPGGCPPAGSCRPSTLGMVPSPGRGVVSCPRASRPLCVGGATGATGVTGATGRNLCFCLRFPSRSSTETASRKNGSLGCRGTRSPSGSAWGRPESGGYGATGATARPGRHPCATATVQGPSATATAQGPAASGEPARGGPGAEALLSVYAQKLSVWG